jgi:hypothetical protein
MGRSWTLTSTRPLVCTAVLLGVGTASAFTPGISLFPPRHSSSVCFPTQVLKPVHNLRSGGGAEAAPFRVLTSACHLCVSCGLAGGRCTLLARLRTQCSGATAGSVPLSARSWRRDRPSASTRRPLQQHIRLQVRTPVAMSVPGAAGEGGGGSSSSPQVQASCGSVRQLQQWLEAMPPEDMAVLGLKGGEVADARTADAGADVHTHTHTHTHFGFRV